MRNTHRLAIAFAYLLTSGGATPAAAQLCAARTGSSGFALEGAYGNRPEFREVGGRAALGTGRVNLSGEYVARNFDDDDDALHTLGASAGYAAVARPLHACPGLRLSRQQLSGLRIWVAAAALELGRPMPLWANGTFTPYVTPMLAWSHSAVGGMQRTSVDPALGAGGVLRFERIYTGAQWERRFLDGVPATWHVFAGLRFGTQVEGRIP